MYTLFVSDVHLSGDNPEIEKSLLQLLQQQSQQTDAIYLLGDMFEYWLGDDAINSMHQPLVDQLKQLHDKAIPVYFMHGNRDFLIGEEFARLTGCTMLDDPAVIDLYGTPTLLMHGDLLCTDDHDYQAFRAMVRSEKWQTDFLGLGIPQRIDIAKKARQSSQAKMQAMQQEVEYIMDVNQSSVEKYLQDANVTQMIHGHTHRPAVHTFTLNKQPAKRIVLGDWCPEPSYLMVSKNEMALHDKRIKKSLVN